MEHNLGFAIAGFLLGLVLVVWFSERLVESTVGTARGFGIPAFLISVIFIGFDPENLLVGSVASYDELAGIALGTVFGSAMVAIALALGITVLIAPLQFDESPKEIQYIQVGSILLLTVLCLDGRLSRLDGALLLGAYVLAVICLARLVRRGTVIRAGGEVAESLDKEQPGNRWKAGGMFLASLAALVAGSEMLVSGSEVLLTHFGMSGTAFGMTLLALVISAEELARELPAALRGRPDITYGNVIGSMLAFFLFNAGVIALVRPVPVGTEILTFYLPATLATSLFLSFLMLRKEIPRWAGGLLFLGYLVFFGVGFSW